MPQDWIDYNAAATDFDGWLGTLEPAKREAVQKSFRFTRPETLPAARQRWLSVGYIANHTGMDVRDVSRNFDRGLYDRFAVQNLGISRPKDGAAFFSALKTTWQQQTLAKQTIEEGRKAARAAALDLEGGPGITAALSAFFDFQLKDADMPAEAQSQFWAEYRAASALLQPHKRALMGLAEAVDRQMKGGAQDGDEAAIDEGRRVLVDMDDNQRQFALAALRQVMEKRGAATSKEKGEGTWRQSWQMLQSIAGPFSKGGNSFRQQTGEVAYRTIAGGMAGESRIAVVKSIEEVPEAGEVQFSGKDISTIEDARAFLSERVLPAISRNTPLTIPGDPGGPEVTAGAKNTIKLDESKAALIREAKQEAMRELEITRQIEDFGNLSDPTPNIFASTLGSSGALLGVTAITRGAAFPITAQIYEGLEYDDLSRKYPEMSHTDKLQVAAISGGIQAALDKVGVQWFTKAPALRELLLKPMTSTLAKRAVGQAALSYTVENLVEAGQDIATPALMAALKSDVPGFDWDKEMSEFYKGRKDVALGMLPLTMIGLGMGSLRDYKGAQDVLQMNEELGKLGVIESDRVAYSEKAQAGDMEGAEAVLKDAMGRRMPEVAAEFQAEAGQQAQAAEQQMREAGVSVGKRGETFVVTTSEAQATFNSLPEALAVARAHIDAQRIDRGEISEDEAHSVGVQEEINNLAADLLTPAATPETGGPVPEYRRNGIDRASQGDQTDIQTDENAFRQFQFSTRPDSDLAQNELAALEHIRRTEKDSTISAATPLLDNGSAEDSARGVLAQKSIAALEAVFGKKILFLTQGQKKPLPFDGASSPDARNVLMLDSQSGLPLMYLTGHELVHSLKAQRPEIWAEMKEGLLSLASDWSDYKKRLAKLKYTEDQLVEEFLGDFVGGEFRKPEFWERMEAQSPTLFKKLAAAVLKFLNVLLKKLAKFERDVSGYFNDIAAARDVVAAALERYAKDRIFPEKGTLTEGSDAELVSYSRSESKTSDRLEAISQALGEKMREAKPEARRQIMRRAKERFNQAKAEWESVMSKPSNNRPKERERLLAAMRSLDAVLSVLPPEVRAKVGGFIKLAELTTDAARAKEIERRFEKIGPAMEKYFRKALSADIKAILEKGQPDAETGKKAKGKDADMHHLFARAVAVSKMDAAAVDAELARLDSLIAGGTLTAEQEVLALTERGVVELVGDLANASAARMAAALETLEDIYGKGWLKWKIREIEKRENRAGARDELIKATGKEGTIEERQAAEDEAQTLLGWLKEKFLSLSSFHEVLNYAFGIDSKQTVEMVDAEREASGQYEDAIQSLGDELQDLFTKLAGGSVLAGERLRFDLSQRSIKTPTQKLSQMEAITALLMWRQEDGRRHMEGTRNERGEVTSKWAYDQAWIDSVEAQLTDDARVVMAWLSAKYGTEYAKLNPLYKQRFGVNLPQHDNYAPITVAPQQSKSGEVVDPLTGAPVSAGSVISPSSFHTRSRSAIAEPRLMDALQVFLAHSRQLEYWKAYYDFAVEANAVLGNREVMNAVHAKGGKEAAHVLRRWVDVIAQGGARDAAAGLALTETFHRLTGRAATVGLLGRISTLLVQSTQLAAAGVKMPVGAYLKGFGRLMSGQMEWGSAINSDFIQRRYKSAPPIVRQAMEQLGKAKRPNHITRSTRALGNLLSGADALFTSGTYAILLDYHRTQGARLGLTGADLEKHAHTEAQRATEQVAQPTRMTARSIAEITNTSPFGKVLWAYSSEARQKIALFAWSAARKDPAYFGKVSFLTFIVGGLMTQVLKNVWKEMKGDDDEEKWSPERLVKNSIAGPLRGIPMVGELTGEPGLFSGAMWAKGSAKDLVEGDYDNPTELLQYIDTILSAAGYFNDNAAGVAALSHLGLDFAKLLENATNED